MRIGTIGCELAWAGKECQWIVGRVKDSASNGRGEMFHGSPITSDIVTLFTITILQAIHEKGSTKIAQRHLDDTLDDIMEVRREPTWNITIFVAPTVITQRNNLSIYYR